MKKGFILLVLCVLLCGTAVSEERMLMGYADGVGEILAACQMRGETYFLSDQGIFRLKEAPEKVLDLSFANAMVSQTEPQDGAEKLFWQQAMRHLFTDGERLYGLHPYSGTLFEIRNNEAAAIGQIPAEYLYHEEAEERFAKEIVSAQLIKGKLFLVLYSFTQKNGDVYELLKWDMAANEATVLPDARITALYEGTGDALLARVKGESRHDADTFWLYDAVAETLLSRIGGESDELRYACAWAEDIETLFYMGEGGRVYAKQPNGQAQIRAYLPLLTAGERDRAFFDAEGLLNIVSGGNLFIRDVRQEGERRQQTLRIMGYLNPSLVMAFAAQRPDIAVITDDGDSSFLGIQAAILSDSGEIDLFVVSSSRAYADMRDKAYAAPMNQSAALLDMAQAFYPVIQKELFSDGQLLAFPLNYTVDAWTLNETLWNSLEPGEFPTTFPALFELLARWEEDYAVDYPDYTLLETYEGVYGILAKIVKQHVLQYETWEAPVSFDTPAFREAIEAAFDKRDILNRNTEGKNPIIMTYHQYFGTGYNDADKVVTVAMPALAENSPRMVMAVMDLFTLNPRSKNAEAALAFVEFYARNMQADFRYALSPSLNTPVRPDGFERMQEESLSRVEALKGYLAKATSEEKEGFQGMIDDEMRYYERRQANTWAITQEDLDIYRALAKNIAVPTRTIFSNDSLGEGNESIDQLIRRFGDGQLSAEQFITALDSVARAMYMEWK
jgi:hypothetical protein